MNVDEDNLNICTERPRKKRKAKVSTLALSRQRRNNRTQEPLRLLGNWNICSLKGPLSEHKFQHF